MIDMLFMKRNLLVYYILLAKKILFNITVGMLKNLLELVLRRNDAAFSYYEGIEIRHPVGPCPGRNLFYTKIIAALKLIRDADDITFNRIKKVCKRITGISAHGFVVTGGDISGKFSIGFDRDEYIDMAQSTEAIIAVNLVGYITLSYANLKYKVAYFKKHRYRQNEFSLRAMARFGKRLLLKHPEWELTYEDLKGGHISKWELMKDIIAHPDCRVDL